MNKQTFKIFLTDLTEEKQKEYLKKAKIKKREELDFRYLNGTLPIIEFEIGTFTTEKEFHEMISKL
jgi:hypothetical protein